MVVYSHTQVDRVPAAVDLIIPARNEQDNIPALMAAVPRRLVRHVIVVDNGSTDQTAQQARAAGAITVGEPRRGYGAACLAGLAWINDHGDPPDVVAFIDADLADDPAGLGKLCEPIAQDRVDLTIGSRRRFAEPAALTGPQRIGNQLACELIYRITGRRYTDMGPMRAIRWSSLQQLDMSDRTWGWTVEMQFKAAVHGLRFLEIDVPYRVRRAGVSKISGTVTGSVRAGWKILTTIAALWWQHRRRPT